MRKPNFFIVGAPKCGTTALSYYLKQHPEVFIPEVKEPHFFGTDLVSPKYIRDERRYLSLFSAAQDEKRVGEASVWYLYSELAAAEIKEFEPSVRIIIMLRDPVEMLHSLHSQFLFVGNEDIVDFETALDAEEDRKRGLRIPKNAKFVTGLFYRETVKYARQVQRYFDTFGRDDVFVVIYDDFRSDVAGVYKETLRFLDVDPDFQPEFRVVNPNKRARSTSLMNFLKSPPQDARRLVRSLVPPSMRRNLGENIKRLNTRYEPRDPVDPELSQRLRTELAEEVERVSQLLGRDLTHWSRI